MRSIKFKAEFKAIANKKIYILIVSLYLVRWGCFCHVARILRYLFGNHPKSCSHELEFKNLQSMLPTVKQYYLMNISTKMCSVIIVALWCFEMSAKWNKYIYNGINWICSEAFIYWSQADSNKLRIVTKICR